MKTRANDAAVAGSCGCLVNNICSGERTTTIFGEKECSEALPRQILILVALEFLNTACAQHFHWTK